jgi:hypothetical protein
VPFTVVCASRHHRGQWSKGYAKLSQPSRLGDSPSVGSWEKKKGQTSAVPLPSFSGADGGGSGWSGCRDQQVRT